jgi:hypothetical protein
LIPSRSSADAGSDRGDPTKKAVSGDVNRRRASIQLPAGAAAVGEQAQMEEETRRAWMPAHEPSVRDQEEVCGNRQQEQEEGQTACGAPVRTGTQLEEFRRANDGV